MKNKTVRLIFLIGEGLVVMMGLVLAWSWKVLPPQIPWFYSLPGGEQQLVDKVVLAIVLAGAAGCLGITKIVAQKVSVEDAPVEMTIMTGGLIAIILLTASFLKVIQIILGL